MSPGKKQLVFVLAALALGACAHKPPPATGQARARQIYYVSAEPFRSLQFSPPPAPGSMEQQADISAVLAWQNKRTEADCAGSALTSGADYDYFWGEKRPFPVPLPDEVKEFFDRLSSDLETAVDNMKDRYQRLRPYKAYPEAQPCIKKNKGFSYPSGHSTFSRVFANVLADMIPERKAEFLAKADEVARDRVIGGVHYPADIAAGKVFGDLYHAELRKSDAYRNDLEKIKTLLVK
jgi:acid phosphatase (class A)